MYIESKRTRRKEDQLVTMTCKLVLMGCILLFLHAPVINCSSFDDQTLDIKVLSVGEELKREVLPLQMGHRLYRLLGLKASVWYEVKISYPASIPASFSIQLKQDKSYHGINTGRKLLNTEKLIFKADNSLLIGDGEVYVLVTVEPEGIVAKPQLHEREHIVFNIVCDELSLGIPHKAWWVGALAFLCVGVALFVPSFLPPHVLPKNQPSWEGTLATLKTS